MKDRIRVAFTGVKDDGLAERQTGKANSKMGNALEALGMFQIILEFLKKRFPSGTFVTARILETGDRDMVKVPEHTEIELNLYAEFREKLENVRKLLENGAEGAALMAGCGAEIKTCTQQDEVTV